MGFYMSNPLFYQTCHNERVHMPSLLAHQPGPGSHTGVIFLEKFAQIWDIFDNFLNFFKTLLKSFKIGDFSSRFSEFCRNCGKSKIISKNPQNFQKFVKSNENMLKFCKFRHEFLVVAATTKIR